MILQIKNLDNYIKNDIIYFNYSIYIYIYVLFSLTYKYWYIYMCDKNYNIL